MVTAVGDLISVLVLTEKAAFSAAVVKARPCKELYQEPFHYVVQEGQDRTISKLTIVVSDVYQDGVVVDLSAFHDELRHANDAGGQHSQVKRPRPGGL